MVLVEVVVIIVIVFAALAVIVLVLVVQLTYYKRQIYWERSICRNVCVARLLERATTCELKRICATIPTQREVSKLSVLAAIVHAL